jgi:hypothetical protein
MPGRSGTANVTGLVLPVDPNCHDESTTTKVLVESGGTVQFVAVVIVVGLFDAICRSCPCPAPETILTVAL